MKFVSFKNCNLMLMALGFNTAFLNTTDGYTSENDIINMICEENISKPQVTYSKVLDFSFVLLSTTTDRQVSELAQIVHTVLSNQTSFVDQDNHNVATRLPHISLGQYAIKEYELDTLKSIINSVAKKFEPITQFMSTKLTVTDENIFFDAKNLYYFTEPILKNLYLKLRDNYMGRIKRKYMIDQAVQEYENQVKDSNQHEIELIDQCFQNWGMPEDNRIRPHYTLIYNYNQSKAQVRDMIRIIEPRKKLRRITFSHLGIVSIDFWGNPRELLYKHPLEFQRR